MAEASVQPNNALPPQTQQVPTDSVQKQPETAAEADPTAKFRGTGTSFRAKLIGIAEVPESRGDKMCQDNIIKLKCQSTLEQLQVRNRYIAISHSAIFRLSKKLSRIRAAMAASANVTATKKRTVEEDGGNVKGSGQHKQKVVINISMEGMKLIDLMTAQVLHEHRVDRISFIARDLTDRRAFGYIVGDDEGNHRFFAIKTAKIAEQVVLVLRDLFQVVYNVKQKEMESAKAQSQTPNSTNEVQQSPTANPQEPPKQQGNILNLEQQLENMQQMSDMDAFKTSWPANTPTTPDTSNTGTDSDMFGMANLSDISSLSSDFSLTSSTNDPAKLKDVKLQQQAESKSLPFRRSSSQKSAASWNGTTSDASSLTQKRHTSLTISRAKELKVALPEIAGQSVKNNAKSTPGSATPEPQRSNHSSKKKDRKNAILEKDSPGHVSVSSNKSGGFGDDSFFDEVMVATGISPPAVRKMSPNKVPDATKASDHASVRTGSTSSISSSGSRRASPKSRSLTNIFFGIKKRSSKHEKKLSRQSSSSSVKSAKQVTTPTDTVSDTKSSGSAEHTPAIASSRSSLRSNRKSSTSSNVSIDPISREHSSSLTSSQTDVTQTKSRSVRVRPSAAVARARPRAALPPSGSTSSKNPPMFKTTSRMINENEEHISESKEQRVGSPASVRSVKSASSKEDAPPSESFNSSDKVSENTGAPDAPSWASFDNETKNDNSLNSKPESPVADSSWGESPNTTSENQQKDAWNAFGDEKENLEKNTNSPTINKDSPLSNDLFSNDNFDTAFADKTSSKEICGTFSDNPGNAEQGTKETVNADFPVDPFSSDADIAMDPTGFETCDPFSEIPLSDISEDPFQNYEAVFGMAPKTEPEQKIETTSESKSTKDELLNSNAHETVQTSTPEETEKRDEIVLDSNTSDNSTITDPVHLDHMKKTSPVITSRRSSTVSSFHSSASSKRSSTASPVIVKTEDEQVSRSTWANFDTEESNAFDKDPFENGVSFEQSFSSPLSNVSSPPPPLPPRPPRRISTPSEDVIALPPAIPPPPLPSRPRQKSRVVDDESSSSSESDLEPTSAPPSFQPPQLPASLQNDLFSTNFDFPPSGASAPEADKTFGIDPSSAFQPADAAPDADSSVFDLPFKKSDSLPPVIPKRQMSKHLTPQLLDYESNPDMQGAGSETGMKRNESYSDDLAGFNMEALQPAAGGGAKMTKDQILAGFGQAPAGGGMYQQQAVSNPFSHQQPAASPLPGQFASPAMPQQYAVPFGTAPQAQFPMAGFPVGPRPVVPARSGAMKLPGSLSSQPNAAPDMFGDVPSSGVLAPVNLQPDLTNGTNGNEEKKSYDPFGSLLPGMGSTDKKDMFKNFKLAKPPSKASLTDQQDGTTGQDAFGNSSTFSAPNDQNAEDPFSSLHFGDPQPQQQSNNVESLFG